MIFTLKNRSSPIQSNLIVIQDDGAMNYMLFHPNFSQALTSHESKAFSMSLSYVFSWLHEGGAMQTMWTRGLACDTISQEMHCFYEISAKKQAWVNQAYVWAVIAHYNLTKGLTAFSSVCWWTFTGVYIWTRWDSC